MRLLVNWERYAQLTGQAILPVALWLLWLTADWGRGEVSNLRSHLAPTVRTHGVR